MSVPDVAVAPSQSVPERGPGPFEEMAQAVDDEIEAVRATSRANVVIVADGERVANGDEFTVYRFAVRRGLVLRDDTHAECELDGEKMDGVVLSARDGELLLSVSRDVGAEVRNGYLVLDNVWLLTALKARLSELAALSGTAILAAADRLLGRAPIHSGYVTPPPPPPVPGRRVLDEQQRAVGCAQGSDTLFLWGPAGTGKSTTVADITAALVSSDSILVVAHTNDAVDSALLKTVERMAGSAELERGQVLRFGPMVNPELRSRFGPLVSFDAVVARRRQELGHRITGLQDEIEMLTAEQEQLERALRRPQIGTTDALDSSARTATRVRLTSLHAQIRRLRSELRAAQSCLETVATDVMKQCRVLATTVHRAYLPRQVDRDFDTVIIDEAGACMPAMAIAAAARARRRIICAGDFRQLGAPVHAKTWRAKRWLGTDVFTIAGIPEAVERGESPAHLVTLRWQFRMAPDIAWLVNEPVYGGLLLDDITVRTRPRGPLGGRALIYVDTSCLAPRTVKRESGTRTNAMHALLVRMLVEKMAAKGLLAIAPGARDPLAVVTPYRGQMELITRHIRRLKGLRGVEAITAHRLQGGERDVVIADFTDSVGATLGHFMTARRLDEESAKLMNVMFTRPRLHLVVVANFDYLLETAPADGLLRQFLLRIRARGRSVDLRELLRRD